MHGLELLESHNLLSPAPHNTVWDREPSWVGLGAWDSGMGIPGPVSAHSPPTAIDANPDTNALTAALSYPNPTFIPR